MSKQVLISGWGQVKQGRGRTGPVLDPLGLMAEASRRAAEAAGSRDILSDLDGIMVVRVMSHHLRSSARQLAERIGASPHFFHVSGIGGNSPQQLVNRAAGMISRGELDSVLIAGGEAYCPRKHGDTVGAGAIFKGFQGNNERKDMVGVAGIEERHGIFLPVHGFPLYETALWAESGLDLDPYTRSVGKVWSDFSKVASTHPFAWLQEPRSVREIVRPGRNNRMVAFPYTKFMTSMVFVDLGAAVILMSGEKARKWRRDRQRSVYFLGGAYTEDTQPHPIQKSSFTTSLSLKTAAERALERSGLGLEALDAFDLYSCFPASVAIARRMIGIPDDDPRPLTLTGGLGFFGGPGNNYSLHAIATMAETIAAGRINTGMVTSLGWFMHKHAVGIYGCRPPDSKNCGHDREDEAGPPVGQPPEKAVERVSGVGRIETYTVLYDRDGLPELGVVYGKTGQGYRFMARMPHDIDLYADLTSRCHVGRKVRLRYLAHENRNRAEVI